MRVETIGNATLRPMDFQVVAPRHDTQVPKGVIKAIAVNVVDYRPTRGWAMNLLPNQLCAFNPHTRFSNFYPSPWQIVPILSVPDRHRPNRQNSVALTSFFEFTLWGEMDAGAPLIPRDITLTETPRSDASRGLPFSVAQLATKSDRPVSAFLSGKGFSARLTGKNSHVVPPFHGGYHIHGKLSMIGSGTTGDIACRRIEDAQRQQRLFE